MKTDLKSVTAHCKRVAKELRAAAHMAEMVPSEHGYRLAEEWAGSIGEELACAAADMAILTRSLRCERVRKTKRLERRLKAEQRKHAAKAAKGEV